MKKNQHSLAIRRPRLVLLLSLPILLLGLWLASDLGMQSRMEDMLPADSASMKAQVVFEEGFDAQDTALLVVQGDTVLSRSFLDAANQEILEQNLVHRTLYRIPTAGLAPWRLLYAGQSELDAAAVALETPMQSLDPAVFGKMLDEMLDETTMEDLWLESDKGNTLLLMMQPKLDAERYAESAQEFLNKLERIVEQLKEEARFTGVKAGITGGAFVQDVEGDRRAMGSLMSSALLTLCLVLVFIILAFRRVLLPLAMMYPLFFGVIWTSAFASVAYGALNTFSIGFAALLFGLGIDFSVHLLNRFLEEQRAGLSLNDALHQSAVKTVPGILIGALTTSMAFFAFLPARFKAFAQIGGLSGVGILILSVVMIVLVPALIGCLRRSADKRDSAKPWKWLGYIGRFARKQRLWVSVFGMILLLALLPNAMKTTLDRNVSQIYPDDLNSLVWMEVVEKEFGWSPNTLTFPVKNLEALRQAVHSLEEREDVLEVRSVLSYLPKNEKARRAQLLELRNKLVVMLGKNGMGSGKETTNRQAASTLMSGMTPEMVQQLLVLLDPPPLTLEALPEAVREMYVGRNGSLLAELLPKTNVWDPESYEVLEHAIQVASGTTPVGMPSIMNDIARLVEEDIPLISLSCLGLAFLMLLILFRRLKAAIVAILPVGAAVWFVLGLMPVLGIPLNLFSIMAFPLIIGIGMDNGIHMVHRILENPEKLDEGVTHTGKALVITTVTTVFAFGSLMTIEHPGMRSLGAAVSLGLLFCLLGTLLWIPGHIGLHPRKQPQKQPQKRFLTKCVGHHTIGEIALVQKSKQECVPTPNPRRNT